MVKLAFWHWILLELCNIFITISHKALMKYISCHSYSYDANHSKDSKPFDIEKMAVTIQRNLTFINFI